MTPAGPAGARAATALALAGVVLAVSAGAGERLASAASAVAVSPVHAEGAPPGHTGGFGEPTCQVCHAEYPLNTDGRLTVEGLPERYEPGRSYTLTVVLTSGGMQRAGFQAAIRRVGGAGEDAAGAATRKAGGASVGTLETAGGEVATTPSEEGGVTYIGHAEGGRWADGEETASWSFAWRAPDEDVGDVVLHAAANSANGDNSPFGDIVYAMADTVGGPEG